MHNSKRIISFFTSSSGKEEDSEENTVCSFSDILNNIQSGLFFNLSQQQPSIV